MALSFCGRTRRLYIPRQQALALKMPAQDAVPEIAGKDAADRQDGDVDAVVISAPPDHPAGPQQRKGDRAPFQTGDGIGGGSHGGSPMVSNFGASWTSMRRRTVRCVTQPAEPAG